MKRLAVFICVAAVCRAQFNQNQYNPFQFGSNNGFGSSPFNSFQAQPFGSSGNNGYNDLFSSNTFNANNFFRAPQNPQNGFQTAGQNAFSSFSGFPFSSGSINQNYNQPATNSYYPNQNFNYQQPQQPQVNIPPPPQQTYQQPANQFNIPPPPTPPAYQPNRYTPVPQQPAYQAPPPPPQQSYQPPAAPYQPPQQQYSAPRAAPYINTAQLSYNAAAPAQPAVNSASSTPTDKPTVFHPPAPVHYVSIGQKLEGDYKFGYETGKGSNGDESFRTETRDADGTVRGSYGYVDSNGKQITVHYEAGREGFKILSEDDAKNPRKAPTSSQQPQQQPQYQQAPVVPATQAPPRNPEPATAPETEASDNVTHRRRYENAPGSPSANLAVAPSSETTTFGPPVIDVNQLSYNIGVSG